MRLRSAWMALWLLAFPLAGMAEDDVMADSTLMRSIRLGRAANEVMASLLQSASDTSAAQKQAEQIVRVEGLRLILKTQAPDRVDALMQAIDPALIPTLISSFQASNEQRTLTTYRADMVVSFDSAKLEKIIGKKLKPLELKPATVIAPNAGQAALVIPIWQDKGATLLWEDPAKEHAWRAALARVALEESRGRLIMPYGDPTDQMTLRPQKLDTVNWADLAPLAARYGTVDVLVAWATPQAGSIKLTIQRFNAQQNTKDEFVVTPFDHEDPPGLLMKAARQVADQVRTRYRTKQEAAQEEDKTEHHVHAVSPITRATDWVRMRSRLMALPMIESVTPSNIGTDRIDMDITFRGKPEAFGEALKAASIHATPQGDALLLGFYSAND